MTKLVKSFKERPILNFTEIWETKNILNLILKTKKKIKTIVFVNQLRVASIFKLHNEESFYKKKEIVIIHLM